jgi:DNA replication and repair protein RecF
MVRLIEIRTKGFRNLVSESVAWSRASNLVAGANGQGKTNLLEAIAVLGNLRSFRVSSMRQVVAHEETEFFLEGRVETNDGVVRLTQQVTPGPPVRRVLEVAGVAASVSRYLRLFPVVTLSGADRELVAGAPTVRRAFLDRCAFLLEPVHFDEVLSFRRTLRQRNAALISAVDEREMEVWEGRLAQAAAVVIHRRRRMCHRLIDSFQTIYKELRSQGFPEVELSYRGEAGMEPLENVKEVEEHYRKRYNETRVRDRRTGFTSEGPHRHDLSLRADGRPVRHMLSSGQSKVVAAALRLASLRQVERERGEFLPVIIDDIDAELDAVVLGRLVEHLEGERQLFFSSTDGGVLQRLRTGSNRVEVHRGKVIAAAGERLDE